MPHPPSAEEASEPRQAVVFVHGIGEPPPMRTLRSFTVGIGLARLFSSPDRMSGSDELRRLTQPPTPEHRAYTDFFELYWADLSPRTDLTTSLTWTLRLLFRRAWWSMPGPVARLIIVLQVLAVVAAALLGWAVVDAVLVGGVAGLMTLLQGWQLWLAALIVVVHLLLGYFLRSILSDAVRYLTPRPVNIESRRRIRADGLSLLRRLHDSGEYERIVLVGHSLGSVIAYDLLRGLWDELRHPDPALAGVQPQVTAFDAAADRIDPVGQPPAEGTYLPPGRTRPPDTADEFASAAALHDYQAAQFELWAGNRRDGVPWLVTDLVTLGSPLTYAPLLLDEPPVAFGGRRGLTLADREALKEYPRCPPIRDELEDSRFYTRDYLRHGHVVPLRVGHTAAPFGPTRWTNLYAPPRSWLRGDFVGGPLARHFGPGVRDVPVRLPAGGGWAWWRRGFPLAHLSYWWAPGGGATHLPEPVELPGADGPAAAHLAALVTALHLDDIRHAPPARRRGGPHPPGRTA